MERSFFLTAITLLFVSIGLALALAAVIYKDDLFGGKIQNEGGGSHAVHAKAFTAPQEEGDVVTSSGDGRTYCMTEGCVKTASQLMDNMDKSVDPCQDFYKFACGGFVDRTVIPDDRTRMSSFSVLGDQLLTQVRMLLEEKGKEGEARPFTMARDVYKSCMDIDNIEAMGLEPIKTILRQLGGWPVLEGPQWESQFTLNNPYIWYEQVYKFRQVGYSVDYFVDFSVTTDLKNSSWRILDLDQPVFGMSREYLIKGKEDPDVQVSHGHLLPPHILHWNFDPWDVICKIEKYRTI